LEKEVEKGEDMLVVDIEKMPSFNLGLKKGMVKGMEKGMEKGMVKGMEKGIEKATIENAKKMIMIGLDIETIHKVTELPMDKINELVEGVTTVNSKN